MTSKPDIGAFPGWRSVELWARITVVAILIYLTTSIQLLPPRIPEPTWSNLEHDSVVVQSYNRYLGSSLVAVSKARSYRMAHFLKQTIDGTIADWSRNHLRVLFLKDDRQGFSIFKPAKHRIAPWIPVFSGNRSFQQIRFLNSSGTRILGLVTDEHHGQTLEVLDAHGKLIERWRGHSTGGEALALGPSRPRFHEIVIDHMGVGAEVVASSGRTLTTVPYPVHAGQCTTSRWTSNTHLMFSCHIGDNSASLFIASTRSHHVRRVFDWQSLTSGISNLTGGKVGNNFVAAALINGTLSFKFGAHSATANTIPVLPVSPSRNGCLPKAVLSWFPGGLFLLGQDSDGVLNVYIAKPAFLQGHEVMTVAAAIPNVVAATPSN